MRLTRVIFLDVDGVLNCRFTPNRFNGYIGLDPEMVELFRKLRARVGAEVVLSSTWRLFPEHREHVEEFIPIADVTPETGGSRGQDIQAWLDNNEVERYAIIDDDRDMLRGQNAFFTEWEVGLTEEVVSAVIAHFGDGA